MSDLLGMYITNVEKEGVFLKLWGQIDKKAALDVELALYKAYVMYEEGKHLLSPTNIQIGVLCSAKYIDEKYYRARITNDETRCQGTVEVNFIDFGNRDIVPIANLRSLDCFNATFITLPPLALPFILSEVLCTGGEWNDLTLELISRQIRYMEVNYAVVSTHLGYKIIKIYLVNNDLSSHLVRNNLMQPISLENQEALLSAMIPRNPQVMPPPDQSLLQYKSVTLEPNSRHEVYVSYITDGPCHFSVQLKKSEGIMAQLMREINSIPLKPFDELPIPGTVCLAKCMEDSHICRAVITSEVDNQYKLFYVDFGNTEVVPPDNLYQMPFKYIIPKIMAIRLSLNGIEKSTVTLEMQCAFKQFVDNRLLMMEVYPSPKKMSLPKCRMWDPETNVDVMDILNKAAQLAFPNFISLHRGFTRPVKVTFVYSCNKFYIHLKSNEDELNKLMAELQVYCNSNSASYLEGPKIGLPCCAQFAFDGQWYRSSILSLNGDIATVKYIDYGNDEDVATQSLKSIEGQFLTCMRPQAIECCLNGYQNMAEDIERDNKLEELILDKEFTMKVIDMIDNKSLVDLIDENGCTVTSLLMDAMINQPKIVTNTNFDGNAKKQADEAPDRNNGRAQDEGFWSRRDKSQNRIEKSEDWRQNSRKLNGTVANDNSEPWRQTNSRNEKEWHDNTSNDSFSRGKKGNRTSPNTKSSNNDWVAPNQDKGYNRKSYNDSQDNSYNHNNQSEWNGKEANRGRNRNSRFDNEAYGNKENTYKRNKSQNSNDSWKNDNSPKSFRDNEEFQGVKRKPRNFNENNRNNTDGSRADNSEWGNKKNSYNDNDNQRRTYREKNSYDSDGSYKKGGQDRSYDRKPKYNDGGDYNKKPFRKDNDFRSNDHERTTGKKFNSRNESKWSDKNSANSYTNNTFDQPKTVADPAPEDAAFQTIDVAGCHKVTLSWFHNPCSFFCQLFDSQQSFTRMMEEIQETYKDIPSSHCSKGAPAIALFPEDNVFYRSRILKTVGSQYKVYYVDFGNISVVDKVWPIDRKYMDLPMQAIPCGLGGIQSVDSEWPDPTAYTNYMQKDYLDCEFLGFEVDRYMVTLFSDGQDIKQLLVQENLAKYIEPLAPPVDFDINMMIGLTFRAMVDYVTDLSDFGMSLQNGVQLMCSAHNLASATERLENELKQREGQIVVVYCDNVIENRLEVTVYDHDGNKLNILSPDEGAYDNIEPVCPYLLIQPKVHGFVSHVDDTSVVIQPSECTEKLEEFLNEMFGHYNELPQESTLIPEEGYLYAVCSEDCNWYRGRVISFNDEKVTVMYVDYGNTEEVEFASLRELDPKFYWWDRMAIQVHINVPTADLLEKTVAAQVYYSEQGLEGEILEVEDIAGSPEGAQPQIDQIEQNFNTSCQISEGPPANPESIKSSLDTSVPIPNESLPSNPTNDGTAVILSHVDSPSDFYIQLADSQNAISELQSQLQEQIESMPVLDNASVGGLCAAPYSVDQMWYRSQILDADEDITTVRFIDYGNTDVIDNKTTQIKTLPAELLALEEYATRCRLKIKPLEDEWSKATTERFKQLAYAENVQVQFINQDEKTNYVELFSNGLNVKDVLIAENLASLDEGVVPEGKLKGYISHMNSPSEFWVQLDGWCAELEWIAEQLSNAASFPDLEDFTPGSLCAAMFPDDGMWYRARILSNTVAGLEVLFLDYGNSCVCGNLKQLPEHLVMAAPLALKCSLNKPEGLFSWSAEAAQKFSDLSADGQTEFTVKKLTTGETSIVELYVNDEPVSSKLLPVTENANVADFRSLSNFAVSKGGRVSNERYGLEKIPGYEYNQEATNKFVEINDEGKTCFEVEYLSDNIVRLYISGTDIRNELLPVLKATLLKSTECSQSENAPDMSTQEILGSIEDPKDVADEMVQDQAIRINDETPAEICRNLLIETANKATGDELSEDSVHESKYEVISNILSNVIDETFEICGKSEDKETVSDCDDQKIRGNGNEERELNIANEEKETTNTEIEAVEPCDTLTTTNETNTTGIEEQENSSGDIEEGHDSQKDEEEASSCSNVCDNHHTQNTYQKKPDSETPSPNLQESETAIKEQEESISQENIILEKVESAEVVDKVIEICDNESSKDITSKPNKETDCETDKDVRNESENKETVICNRTIEENVQKPEVIESVVQNEEIITNVDVSECCDINREVQEKPKDEDEKNESEHKETMIDTVQEPKVTESVQNEEIITNVDVSECCDINREVQEKPTDEDEKNESEHKETMIDTVQEPKVTESVQNEEIITNVDVSECCDINREVQEKPTDEDEKNESEHKETMIDTVQEPKVTESVQNEEIITNVDVSECCDINPEVQEKPTDEDEKNESEHKETMKDTVQEPKVTESVQNEEIIKNVDVPESCDINPEVQEKLKPEKNESENKEILKDTVQEPKVTETVQNEEIDVDVRESCDVHQEVEENLTDKDERNESENKETIICDGTMKDTVQEPKVTETVHNEEITNVDVPESCDVHQETEEKLTDKDERNESENKETIICEGTMKDSVQVSQVTESVQKEEIITNVDVPESCDTNQEVPENPEESFDVSEKQQEAAENVTDTPELQAEPSSPEGRSTEKIEYTETIITTFSAPTVSEKESQPKLSPSKVTMKMQETGGDEVV